MTVGQCFDVYGWRRVVPLKWRIKNHWLFGWAIYQELFEHRDGSRKWRKLYLPNTKEEGK